MWLHWSRLCALMCLVVVPTAGCLGADRCGAGQELVGERCAPTGGAGQDAGGDAAADQGGAGCAYKPTPATLVGEFEFATLIAQSNCTITGLQNGQPIDGGIRYAAGAPAAADAGAAVDGAPADAGVVDGGAAGRDAGISDLSAIADLSTPDASAEVVTAAITTAFISLDGPVSIGDDGRVLITAEGELAGLRFVAEAVSCFGAADEAAMDLSIRLSSAGTPLCSLSAKGSQTRKP